MEGYHSLAISWLMVEIACSFLPHSGKPRVITSASAESASEPFSPVTDPTAGITLFDAVSGCLSYRTQAASLCTFLRKASVLVMAQFTL